MSYVLVYGSEPEYAQLVADVLEENGLRIVELMPEPASFEEALKSLGKYRGQVNGVILLYADSTVLAYIASNLMFNQYLVADPREDDSGFYVDVYSMFVNSMKLFTARQHS